MILPNMYLFEAAVGGAGDGEQDVVQIQIVAPWQSFNVFPADGIGLTGRVGLDGNEGRHDFQRNVLGLRQSQHDWFGLFLADRNHHVLATIGILDGLDGKHPVARGNQQKSTGIGRRSRCHQGPFRVPQFHGGLCHAPQVCILHVAGNRLVSRGGEAVLRHSPKQRQGDSKDEPCPPDGLSRECCHRTSPSLSMVVPLSLLRGACPVLIHGPLVFREPFSTNGRKSSMNRRCALMRRAAFPLSSPT